MSHYEEGWDDLDKEDDDGLRKINIIYQLLLVTSSLWAASKQTGWKPSNMWAPPSKQCGNPATLKEVPEDEESIKRYTKKQLLFPIQVKDWATQLNNAIYRPPHLRTWDDLLGLSHGPRSL